MAFQEIFDPSEFRDVTAALVKNEAAHNLLRGILGNLIEHPDTYEEFRLYLSHGEQGVVSAGLMTKPYNLILADVAEASHVEGLVDGLVASTAPIPGVIGNRPTVDQFAQHWSLRTGASATLAMSQGIFEATVVREPDAPIGEARPTTIANAELLFDWMNRFLDEALPDEPRDDERMRSSITRQIGSAGIWVWVVGGRPVSMTSHGSPTGSGIRIGGVYTPKDDRGHGYASALVAAQTSWLLSNGYRRCFLFTDLANPTSNAIYQRIGYGQVGEGASYTFGPSSPGT